MFETELYSFDWPLSGFSQDYNDKSHKFYFDDLGILVLPKTIHEPFVRQSDETSSWDYNLRGICRRLGIEEEFFFRQLVLFYQQLHFQQSRYSKVYLRK